MDIEIEERKKRLESYLDEHGIPKGRKRSGDLAKKLDCARFTALRMLEGQLPRPATAKKLVSICENANPESTQVGDTVKHVFHGVLRETNVIIMGYVAAAVEIRAMELEMDLDTIDATTRENLWTTVYEDACENNGTVDKKIVNALLVNLKKSTS